MHQHSTHLGLTSAVRTIAVAFVVFTGGHAAEPDDSLALAVATGRPVLAIGSGEHCGPCRALHGLLQSSRVLEPLLKDFVVLEMDASSPEFQRFAALYPANVAGIPMVYVIRGDGEALYARAGGLPEESVQQLLQYALDESGTCLTVEEVADYQQQMQDAEDMAQRGRPADALKLIEEITAVSSCATVVTEARQYHTELVQAIQRWLDHLEREMGSEGSRYSAAYRIAELYVALDGNSELRSRAGESLVRLETETTTRNAVRQAKDLVRGRLQEERKLRDAAISSYRRVLEMDADSPSAVQAQRRLAVLLPQGNHKLVGQQSSYQVPGRMNVKPVMSRP